MLFLKEVKWFNGLLVGLIITVCRIIWNHHFSKGHNAGLVKAHVELSNL